jgi:hypothetical protein
MANKKTTIEDLARMIKNGFDETATKSETATKTQMVKVEERLGNIEWRLDNIEKLTIKQQNEKINNIDRRLIHLEEMFAVK